MGSRTEWGHVRILCGHPNLGNGHLSPVEEAKANLTEVRRPAFVRGTPTFHTGL